MMIRYRHFDVLISSMKGSEHLSGVAKIFRRQGIFNLKVNTFDKFSGHIWQILGAHLTNFRERHCFAISAKKKTVY